MIDLMIAGAIALASMCIAVGVVLALVLVAKLFSPVVAVGLVVWLLLTILIQGW